HAVIFVKKGAVSQFSQLAVIFVKKGAVSQFSQVLQRPKHPYPRTMRDVVSLYGQEAKAAEIAEMQRVRSQD
ncbi:hypothetical protein KIPB_014290, partial [Kipferlia bialata]